jgi:hypothetical protein
MSEQMGLVKRLEGEILGPESAFAVERTKKRNEWGPIVESAKMLTIVDAESKERAVGHGRLLQASAKAVQEMYTGVKQSIDSIKKPVLEAEKQDIGAITVAKDTLAQKVLVWNREQERIHAEAVRKAQEEARKAAEEQKLADAIAAEQAGEKEEAEQILNEPTMAMPVIVQKVAAKVQGEVTKTTYTAEVTNLMELVKAVARGVVPIQALCADVPFLNSQARSFSTGLNYPGVKVNQSTSTHFRS